jgi:hypothetical protein
MTPFVIQAGCTTVVFGPRHSIVGGVDAKFMGFPAGCLRQRVKTTHL